jgi:hypothetical protein
MKKRWLELPGAEDNHVIVTGFSSYAAGAFALEHGGLTLGG